MGIKSVQTQKIVMNQHMENVKYVMMDFIWIKMKINV